MYHIEPTTNGGVRVILPGGETDDNTGEYPSFKAAVEAISGKRNKYFAEKVELDGFIFDSVKEANRYMELVVLWRAGEIAELKVHPVYEIHPPFTVNGVAYKAIKYEADFSYTEAGRWIVEDVKSKVTKTAVFRLKQKLFMRKFPSANFRIVE